MAYQSIEADERIDSGPNSLEFRSFLPNDGAQNNLPSSSSRGYYGEQPTTRSSKGFWTIEYYQQYFDVDTKTVLKRCYTTLLPISPNYRTAHLNPSVDLYGPFWTLTTLIFSLFVFSSLASSITSYLSRSPFIYDFQLLSIGVTLVYVYGLGIPIVLWVVLRYLGVSEWSPAEAVAVFGYGQFVWIPVALLCVIPVPIVRWVLVGAAFLLSGYYLFANIYPVIASAEQKATRLLIVVLAILHTGLAITFKVLFFNYYVVDAIGGGDPLAETDPIASMSITATTLASATSTLTP